MKNSKNDVENFNNLVFEKRNKNYGAFAIRQSYNGTAIKSTLITGGAFLALVIILALLAGGGTITNDTDMGSNDQKILSATPVDNTPKEELKPKPASNAAARASNIFIASNSPLVDTTIKFNPDANVVGKSLNPLANGTSITDTSTVVTTNTVVTTATVAVTPKVAKLYADKMPAFKGDIRIFIRDNIVFPQEAIEVGVDGTVYVQFIVEEDGSITNAKIVKKLGLGCDEQAISVVKKMPKWEPGMDKGEPVKVIFNLPIKFKTTN
ncbi:MAG: energy transducer TonB [Bacteroidia bacterium]|nr:energy transducer TonB [Bacteroidia bacterium]